MKKTRVYDSGFFVMILPAYWEQAMSLFSPLTLPWDCMILMLLVVSSIFCALAIRRSRKQSTSRWKRVLSVVTAVLSGTIVFVILYGSFIEPQIIVVSRGAVDIGIVKPVTVALISDLHVGPYKGSRFVRRVVARINELHPDIVVIAGDFVLDEEISAAGLTPLEGLKDLRSTYGTFAVSGNHDHGIFRYFDFLHIQRRDHAEQLVEFLRSLGITVLLNESVDLKIGTEILSIAGVEDVWSRKTDIVKALSRVHRPTILLAHNPDIILDDASNQADLIVTGHTHGGQIRLPWYGAISRLPTHLGRKYDQGLFALPSGNTLAITRGIGESGPRARLFAPPEIFLITLR